MKPSWPSLLLLGSLGITPAHAAAARLSPAQQQAIFPDQKALILGDQQDRLHTIELGQTCVRAARNPEQLMACLVEEHQRSLRISAQHQAAMLAILQRHGVQTQPPVQP